MNRPLEPNGFSLVEVIVAMLILTVGVLAMAASTGYIFAQMRDSGRDTERALALQQVVEELRATPFDNLVNAATTNGVFTVTWQVTQPTGSLKRVEIVTEGPGYRPGHGWVENVADTTRISVVR